MAAALMIRTLTSFAPLHTLPKIGSTVTPKSSLPKWSRTPPRIRPRRHARTPCSLMPSIPQWRSRARSRRRIVEYCVRRRGRC
ncbi:hypothetical protein HOY80DRAFT_991557 [Tuber brumale]|nr:hypothetical protein HOY80DRAFT_991557 [Tuber brumale]